VGSIARLSIARLSIARLSIARLSIAPLSIAPLSIAPLSIAAMVLDLGTVKLLSQEEMRRVVGEVGWFLKGVVDSARQCVKCQDHP
jgi:hypothetical protein